MPKHLIHLNIFIFINRTSTNLYVLLPINFRHAVYGTKLFWVFDNIIRIPHKLTGSARLLRFYKSYFLETTPSEAVSFCLQHIILKIFEGGIVFI